VSGTCFAKTIIFNPFISFINYINFQAAKIQFFDEKITMPKIILIFTHKFKNQKD